jgi:hypothetical protein
MRDVSCAGISGAARRLLEHVQLSTAGCAVLTEENS